MASPAATGSTAATDDEPQEAILLSHGAFNPVRRQHIDMMVQSRKRVEQAGYKVVGGILALKSTEFIRRKKETAAMLNEHRLAALRAACQSADGPPGWLKPDAKGVYHSSPGQMIQTLKGKHPGVTVFNVVGADSVVKLCKNGSKFLQPMVVVGRAGFNNKVVQETAENSAAAGVPAYYVEELAGLARSTDALKALEETQEESLKAFVPASAAKYLLKNRDVLFGDHVHQPSPPKWIPSGGESGDTALWGGDDPSEKNASNSEHPPFREQTPEKPKTSTKPRQKTSKAQEQRPQKGGASGYTFNEETTSQLTVSEPVPQPQKESGGSLPQTIPYSVEPFTGEIPFSGRPTLVVGITGAPSAGKSSLAQELQYMLWERYGTRSNAIIAQQDFDLGNKAGSGAWLWQRNQWLSYWESPDATDWEKMERETLEAVKQHPIVIVEGHCLFSSERLYLCFNSLIWLDVDEEGCWDRRAEYPGGWEPAHYFYKCLWPGHREHMSQALGVQRSAPGCDGKSASIGPSRSLSLHGLDQPSALRERALKAVLRWASSMAPAPASDLAPALSVPAVAAAPLLMQCQ